MKKGSVVDLRTRRPADRPASGVSQISLSEMELRAAERGFCAEIEQQLLWIFPLPDRIREAVPAAYESAPGENSNPPNVLIFGSPPAALRSPETWVAPSLICFNNSEFFLKTRFPLTPSTKGRTAAVILWARVDMLTASQVISLLSGQMPDQPTDSPAIGSCANLLLAGGKPAGLYSLLQIPLPAVQALPTAAGVDDRPSPFPGLALLYAAVSPQDAQQYVDEQQALDKETAAVAELEAALVRETAPEAAAVIDRCSEHWLFNARAHYAGGCLRRRLSDHASASRSFHQAQLLDHPRAFSAELAEKNAEAKSFRERYPEVFDQIRSGDRYRSLTVLRYAAQIYPLIGNAILSYCLRGAGVPEEGLRACNASLSLDPLQSDVLSTKWSFLLELGHDEQGLETALAHLLLYPQDPAANANLCDSLLLTGRSDDALLFAHRYFIFTESPQHAVKQLFKSYEACGMWPELAEVLDRLLPIISGPTPEILALWGEALNEAGRFEESRTVLERALTIAPGSASIVLGYARLLARSDNEAEAAALLEAVLADRTRIDKLRERALLVTMLAEIRRRTGAPEEGLEALAHHLPGDLVRLSAKIGPAPALEYADCLIACSKPEQARAVLTGLREKWPDEPGIGPLLDYLKSRR